MRKWAPLMTGYLVSADEEVGLINALQKYFEEHGVVESAFVHALHSLYDVEIVSEEAVFAWEEALRASDRPDRRFLHNVRSHSTTLSLGDFT